MSRRGSEKPERIVFELNGQQQSVEVAPDTPLLYVLRDMVAHVGEVDETQADAA